jgi:hypothetical protein
MQSTQTLQLFMKIIKTKIIYKSYKNARWKDWVWRPSYITKMGEET